MRISASLSSISTPNYRYNTMQSIRFQSTAAKAFLIALPIAFTGFLEASAPITEITVTNGTLSSNNNYLIDDVVPVSSLHTASEEFSNIIGATEVFHASADGVAGATKGVNDSSPYTTTDALLGNNLTRNVIGEAPELTYNVLFGQSITTEVFYLEFFPSNEAFSLQAITGGTVDSPVLSGSIVTFETVSGASFTDIGGEPVDGVAVRDSRDSDVLFGQFGGYSISVSDFGVSSLIGVQWTTTETADPSAFYASIPEPETFALMAGALMLTGVMLRRRFGAKKG